MKNATTTQAPGRADRKGIPLTKLIEMFPDDESARKWFEAEFWPDGANCPHCGSFNVQCNAKHPTMTHRCRDCPKRPFFSVRIGTVMEDSKLGFRDWAIAIYQHLTNLKGVSSMKLHRDLDRTQKTTWFMGHRLRKALEGEGSELFHGPVEVDEAYMGGLEKNKHKHKKLDAGRGAVGKVPVVGMKDRNTNKIQADVVDNTTKATLQGYILDRTDFDTMVFTDEAKAYENLFRPHGVVRHSVKEFVNGMAHTNGMESFWNTLKKGFHGIFHHWSGKHLNRYVQEAVGKHNMRDKDTQTQMGMLVRGMRNKRLTYAMLIA